MSYSKAEREAWREKMADLAGRLKAMSPEQKTDMVSQWPAIATCEGRVLGHYNTCALLYQWANAEPLTMIGGFRQWQKVGRKVSKGQHAAGYILVPMGNKKSDADDMPADDDKKESVRFRWVAVFDVSQTEEIEQEKRVRMLPHREAEMIEARS